MNERIKKIRKISKLTQFNFGEKIGVKGNTVTNYENGLRKPSDAIILSICREFNVNEKWLRTGEGEIFNYSEDDSLIEKLSAEYKLNGFVKRLLKKYLELTEQQRNAVNSFLDKVYEEEFSNFQSSVNTSNEISATTTKDEVPLYDISSVDLSYEEIKQDAIDYFNERILEKKEAERLSTSKQQKSGLKDKKETA